VREGLGDEGLGVGEGLAEGRGLGVGESLGEGLVERRKK
jgi:hypothetical protein